MKKIYIYIVTAVLSMCSILSGQNDGSDSYPYLVPFLVGDLWGFSDYGGDLIVPAQFEDVTLLTPTRAAVAKNGHKALIELHHGILLTGYDYTEISRQIFPTSHGPMTPYYDIEVDECRGLMDSLGTVLIQPKYDRIEIHRLNPSQFIVRTGDQSQLISLDGTKLSAIDFEHVGFGFGHPWLEITEGDKAGYMDHDGRIISGFKYDPIPFERVGHVTNSTNYGSVYSEGKFGILDKNGVEIQPMEFDAIEVLDDSLFVLRKDRVLIGTNPAGEQMFPSTIDDIKEYYRFEDHYLFEAGVAERYGLYCSATGWIIPPSFDDIDTDFQLRLVVVRDQGKYGVFDLDGRPVVPLRYESIRLDWHKSDFPRIRFRENGLYGFMDLDGNVMVSAHYDYLDSFLYGRSFAKKDGKVGYIDTTGTVVISLQYDHAFSQFDGTITGVRNGEKWGCVNRTGDVIIAIENDFVSPQPWLGVIQVERASKHALFDLEGNQLTDFEFDQILCMFDDSVFTVTKWPDVGLINHRGETILPVEFDRVWWYGDHIYGVHDDGKRFWVRKDGYKYLANSR